MKNNVFSSLVWKFLERGSVQVIQFVVSVIVARLLLPADFGLVALLTVFISIATVFVQSGLGTALIQSKDVDERDFSSVFYYSLGIATLVYALLFATSPYIELFYNMPELASIMKVMSLCLFPGAINVIQNAIAVRSMRFKEVFKCNLAASVISGIIGVTLAYLHFGIWAIVVQQLAYQSVVCIFLGLFIRWRPHFYFSFYKTRKLLSYGVNLLGASLVDTVYHNLESLIIGKKYCASTLAFFNKGKMFPLILINNIDGSLQSVMLPAMSARQDCLNEVKAMLRKSVSMSLFVSLPAMILLAVCADPLIYMVLGTNWMESVPFLQLYCLISVMFPIQTSSIQAINSIGRSSFYFRIMMFKRVFGVALLIVFTLWYKSAFGIVFACVIIEMIAVCIQTACNKHIFNYTYSEQWHDVRVTLTGALGVFFFYMLAHEVLAAYPFLNLCFRVSVGMVVYIIISWALKSKELNYCLNKLKRLRK